MFRLNWIAFLVALLGITACDGPPGTVQADVVPVYDARTAQLVRLDYDSNHDGLVDTRTYMQGTHVRRAESDTDRDGKVDRWEYFDTQGRQVRVGGSSARDGLEDTWMSTEPATGLTRLDYSTRRDRRIDRREFLSSGTLVRAEEDTNGDGLADKWETYDHGRLTEVALDTTYGAGRPDRRLIYGAGGELVRIEPVTR